MSMIEDFFKKYSEPIDATPVPKEVLKKYENKLPEPIIEMWKRHGFSGYEDGIFWTINPDEYQSYVNRSGNVNPGAVSATGRVKRDLCE